MMNIQKQLLTTHLGLEGISDELLDTFPVQNLLEKSDSNVCVTYGFHLDESDEEEFLKALKSICKILKVEASSFEKKFGDLVCHEVAVFYSSDNLHWSDEATIHVEKILAAITHVDIKLSFDVSINN
ncbi:hypothetical protein [Halobacteriovorax sp. HLS]|uniref:hypothetical protein n=1 Tax=Halobacteriovorax sp. HLS TaxID=2234000 RepID=UPI000FDBF46B|nr:hypothetical protein [Halobacteriovorax sp. HLS]